MIPSSAMHKLFALAYLFIQIPNAYSLYPTEVSQLPHPRPCCAFGYNFKAALATHPVPIKVKNIPNYLKLGKHTYAPLTTVQEKEGLVYSCSGGFLDIAHIRDHADWTTHLAFIIKSNIGTGRVIELPQESGQRKIYFYKAALPEDSQALIFSLAQKITYELGVWHEIVTWYDDPKTNPYSVKHSAFSPEDFYSNILGINLGVQAIQSPLPYDQAMDALIRKILVEHHALSPFLTQQAFDAVDGIWWDSRNAELPNERLLLKRNFNWGPIVEPWVIENFTPCKNVKSSSTRLEVPQTHLSGKSLNEYYTLEITPDKDTLEKFPLSKLTSKEFSKLIQSFEKNIELENIRQEHNQDEHITNDNKNEESPLFDEDKSLLIKNLSSIHLLRLRALGGASATKTDSSQFSGGIGADLIQADTPGGDLGAVLFDVYYDHDRKGLMIQFTLAQSQVLFFCEDTEENKLHSPLFPFLARSQACKETSLFGMGGKLGQFQYDGNTGRGSVRPIEINAVLNLLQNGYSQDYLYRRVLAYAGAQLESVFSPKSNSAPAGFNDQAELSTRLNLGLLGMLRSKNGHWEAQALIGYRPDLLELHDQVLEVGAKLFYHFLFSELSDNRSMVSIGSNVSYSYYEKPKNSFHDWFGPFVSDRDQKTWQFFLTVGINQERFSF